MTVRTQGAQIQILPPLENLFYHRDITIAKLKTWAPCGLNEISADFGEFRVQNSPKSAEISWRHKERSTQDFRSVYFNLFLVILPNFGSLSYTTVILYKPLYGTPLLGLPVNRPLARPWECSQSGGQNNSWFSPT